MKFGKKILALGLMGVLALSVLTGCGSTGGTVSYYMDRHRRDGAV